MSCDVSRMTARERRRRLYHSEGPDEGKLLQQRVVAILCRHHKGVLVLALPAADVGRHGVPAVVIRADEGFCQHMVEIQLCGIAVPGRSVVELNVLSQVESVFVSPSRFVSDGPAGCESWKDLASGPVRHQPLMRRKGKNTQCRRKESVWKSLEKSGRERERGEVYLVDPV